MVFIYHYINHLNTISLMYMFHCKDLIIINYYLYKLHFNRSIILCIIHHKHQQYLHTLHCYNSNQLYKNHHMEEGLSIPQHYKFNQRYKRHYRDRLFLCKNRQSDKINLNLCIQFNLMHMKHRKFHYIEGQQIQDHMKRPRSFKHSIQRLNIAIHCQYIQQVQYYSLCINNLMYHKIFILNGGDNGTILYKPMLHYSFHIFLIISCKPIPSFRIYQQEWILYQDRINCKVYISL